MVAFFFFSGKGIGHVASGALLRPAATIKKKCGKVGLNKGTYSF